MQVSQLYFELALIAHVPVVVAFLPERRRGADPSAQPFREGGFEEVQGFGEGGLIDCAVVTQISVQRADANLGPLDGK